MTDWRLLRRYLDEGSETAFSQIVDRHKKLVYWACRRDIGDAQLAEDATQMVFVILARKGAAIRKDASLVGWLFSVARQVSMNVQTSERRRRQHEERVTQQMRTELNPCGEWDLVEPWLNDALSDLSAADRGAVLLRFSEGHSFPEIAGLTSSTEEAVRKRVHRSLERMRRYLAKRDVSVATVTLGVLLLEHSSNSVIETCATVTGTSILAAASSITPAQAVLLKKGLYFTMEATKRKLIATGVIAILAMTGGTIAVAKYRQATQLSGITFEDMAADAAVGRRANVSTLNGPTADATATAAARSAIDNSYGKMVAALRTNDVTTYGEQLDSQWVMDWPNGKVMGGKEDLMKTPISASTPGYYRNIQLVSFSIKGSEAYAGLVITTGEKGGHSSREWQKTETNLDHWRLTGGKWLLVRTTMDGAQQ